MIRYFEVNQHNKVEVKRGRVYINAKYRRDLKMINDRLQYKESKSIEQVIKEYNAKLEEYDTLEEKLEDLNETDNKVIDALYDELELIAEELRNIFVQELDVTTLTQEKLDTILKHYRSISESSGKFNVFLRLKKFYVQQQEMVFE